MSISNSEESVARLKDGIDWEKFLARHDMTWSVRPLTWDDGAFLGNGLMGAMIYSEEHKSKRNVLRYVMGHTEVTAKKPGTSGYPPRVPVGEFEFEAEGPIYYGTTMRLDLWNAELRADIITTKGKVQLRSFIHSEKMVLVIEIETTEGERGAKVQWYPYPEVAPVLKYADSINVNMYIPETKVDTIRKDGVNISTQRYSETEGCTTAWEEVIKSESRRIYYISLVNGCSEDDVKKAEDNVRDAVSSDLTAFVETHRSWWHQYYKKSFISLSDTRLEGFYWIQMYKLAAATRAEYRIIDNQGPWLSTTPWPGSWFNMNVQMAYSPVYTSNRLEIGESLCRELDRYRDNLILNAPEEYRHDSAALGRSSSYNLRNSLDKEIGDLTWVCHNVWRQYRHSMEDTMLRNSLYPLLRRSINFYLHILEKEADGKLHMPETISPEYGSFLQLTVRDSHYDLALLRWGCETLLWICGRLQLEDPLMGTWKDVLEHLVEFPVDDTGFMVGKDVPLTHGHRHFSHLLAVFPLHLLSGEQEEERNLIYKSLRHWFSMEGDLRGFTFTGAASIAATIGRGDEALQYLKMALELFKPNTMYKEAGPVIESPLAAAEAINDMLLQSWGGKIRVFPAIPKEWKDVTFHRFRAEGAFLVSAVRKDGKTRFICIESLAGEPCTVMADLEGEIRVVGNKPVSFKKSAPNIFELDLKKGEQAILYAGSELCDLTIEPIEAEAALCNYFGGNKPWRLYGIPYASL